MTEDEYILLYEKYKKGQCSAAEVDLLMEYNNGFELQDRAWSEEEHGNREEVHQQILNRLEQSINRRPKMRYLPIMRWTAAAVVLVVIATGTYKLLHQQKFNAAAAVKSYRNDILPGTNKAILRLSTGAVIVLDSAKNGVIAKEGNVSVKKTNNGQLVYNVSSAGALAVSAMNTISVPRGGQYQLLLPDGSKVWLNAASSLSFPTAFTGKERNVTLTGEAYFEVAHNKNMPFNVSVKQMKVQVLGTHFNITAYNDEDSFRTTLLEGSVRLSNGKTQALLKPGQQGVLDNKLGSLAVTEVNTADAIAWKNGYFVFDHEDIKQVMRKIARWYNVDVDYAKEVPDDLFSGAVNRFVNVSKVLEKLEMTGQLHCKINGRRISVAK